MNKKYGRFYKKYSNNKPRKQPLKAERGGDFFEEVLDLHPTSSGIEQEGCTEEVASSADNGFDSNTSFAEPKEVELSVINLGFSETECSDDVSDEDEELLEENLSELVDFFS